MGDLAAARDYGEQALGLYRRTGDELSAANVRNNLGLIHRTSASGTAIAQLGRPPRGLSPPRSLRGHGHAAHEPGIVFQKMGEWDRAMEHYRGMRVRCWCRSATKCSSRAWPSAWATACCGSKAPLRGRNELPAGAQSARAAWAPREEVLALGSSANWISTAAASKRRCRAITKRSLAGRIGARRRPRRRRDRTPPRRGAGRARTARRGRDRVLALAPARALTDDRLEHAVTHRVAGEIAALARGSRVEAAEAWATAETLLRDCHERLEMGKTPPAGTHRRGRARGAQVPVPRRRAVLRTGQRLVDRLPSSRSALPRLERHVRADPHRIPVRAPPSRAQHGGVRTPCDRSRTFAPRRRDRTSAALVTGETAPVRNSSRARSTGSPRSNKPFLGGELVALRADSRCPQLFGHRKGVHRRARR